MCHCVMRKSFRTRKPCVHRAFVSRGWSNPPPVFLPTPASPPQLRRVTPRGAYGWKKACPIVFRSWRLVVCFIMVYAFRLQTQRTADFVHAGSA